MPRDEKPAINNRYDTEVFKLMRYTIEERKLWLLSLVEAESKPVLLLTWRLLIF